MPCLWLQKMSETSVKIIKNEVRCRDDTVPKTVDTRKHCKVGLRACNNLPQPPPYIFVFRIVACSQPYLAVLSCIYGFWHGVIPTSYYSFLMLFTLVHIQSLAIYHKTLMCKPISTVIVIVLQLELCVAQNLPHELGLTL